MNDEKENFRIIDCSNEKEMMRLIMLHELHEEYIVW